MGTPATRSLLQERHAKLQSLSPAARRAAARMDAEARQAAELALQTQIEDGRVAPEATCAACKPKRRTINDVLLEAAQGFGAETFGLTALVLAAWKLAPQQLGLPGAEEYHPSDNRVRAALWAKDGLVANGVLERVGKNLLRVKP